MLNDLSRGKQAQPKILWYVITGTFPNGNSNGDLLWKTTSGHPIDKIGSSLTSIRPKWGR